MSVKQQLINRINELMRIRQQLINEINELEAENRRLEHELSITKICTSCGNVCV